MIIKAFSNIDLDDKKFRLIDLKEFNDFYLIGIKDDENVKSITFEVAIDSGVKNKPLILPNIKLEFNRNVDGVRILNHPNQFYIRPVQIITKSLEAKTNGKFNVEINVNALNLG